MKSAKEKSLSTLLTVLVYYKGKHVVINVWWGGGVVASFLSYQQYSIAKHNKKKLRAIIANIHCMRDMSSHINDPTKDTVNLANYSVDFLYFFGVTWSGCPCSMSSTIDGSPLPLSCSVILN
jgi:hypothetical protein